MKKFINFPVYLLSLIYLVFGLNYFLHFITMPPMTGDASTFIGLLYSTGFLAFVKVIEVILAVLMLVSATRALAILLIAPITLNILLFEILIAHQPGIGILLVLLNAWVIYTNKNKYASIVNSINIPKMVK